MKCYILKDCTLPRYVNGGRDQNYEDLAEHFTKSNIPFETLEWHIRKDGGEKGFYYIDKSVSDPAYEILEKRVNPSVILNGSGLFHDRTYFFVRSLGVNLDYAHIDAHIDITRAYHDGIIDYGSFVNHITLLEHVKNIYLIGAHIGNIISERFPIRVHGTNSAEINKKIKMFMCAGTRKKLDQISTKYTESFGRKYYTFEHYRENFFWVKKFDDSNLGKNPRYISTDLDVITDFPTEWSRQGRLTVDRTIKIIEKIKSQSMIAGADITGYDYKCMKSDKKKEESMKKITEIYLALTQ